MYLRSPEEFAARRSMRVLGVDPSIANCGWGVIEAGRLVDYGIIHTSPKDDEFARYERIAEALTDIVGRLAPDVAVVEQFMHFFRSAPSGAGAGGGSRQGKHARAGANPEAMFKLKGAQTTVVQTCLGLGLGVVRYYPKQWKGDEKKEVNRVLMTAAFGVVLPNDDTADGVGLAYHYLSTRRGVDPVLFAGRVPDGVIAYVPPVDMVGEAKAKLKAEAKATAKLKAVAKSNGLVPAGHPTMPAVTQLSAARVVPSSAPGLVAPDSQAVARKRVVPAVKRSGRKRVVPAATL